MPRDDPPVGTCGRPLGDFEISAILGVSQSRAGEVVEKHRDSGEAVKVVDKPNVGTVSFPAL